MHEIPESSDLLQEKALQQIIHSNNKSTQGLFSAGLNCWSTLILRRKQIFIKLSRYFILPLLILPLWSCYSYSLKWHHVLQYKQFSFRMNHLYLVQVSMSQVFTLVKPNLVDVHLYLSDLRRKPWISISRCLEG